MIRYSILCTSLICLLAISCIKEGYIERRYVLVNDSNHTITLNFVDFNDDPSYSKTLEMKGGTFSASIKAQQRTNVGAFEAFEANSVEIKFDDKKVLFYHAYDDDDGYNILYNTPYQIDGETYTYRFSDTDFDRAELIDPN